MNSWSAVLLMHAKIYRRLRGSYYYAMVIEILADSAQMLHRDRHSD